MYGIQLKALGLFWIVKDVFDTMREFAEIILVLSIGVIIGFVIAYKLWLNRLHDMFDEDFKKSFRRFLIP